MLSLFIFLYLICFLIFICLIELSSPRKIPGMPMLCARQAQPEYSRDICKVAKLVSLCTPRHCGLIPLWSWCCIFDVLFGSYYLAYLAGPSQSTAIKHAAVLSPDKQEPASSDIHIEKRSDNQLYRVWRGYRLFNSNASHRCRTHLP